MKNFKFVNCCNVIFTNYRMVSSLVVASYPKFAWTLHGKILYLYTEQIKSTEESSIHYPLYDMISVKEKDNIY